MTKVIGIVNLHTTTSFDGLTERRPSASVSFLGRYALIDFVLSNMSNSNIDTVGVLIQEKPRSLFKHLGGGDSWNFNSKAGGISFLYNEKYANNKKYNHDLNNLEENIHIIESANAKYVVIAPAHILTTMNYDDMITAHEKTGARITVAYQHINNGGETFIGAQTLKIEDGLIKSFAANKGVNNECDVSLETYVINKDALCDIIRDAKKASSFFKLKDALAYYASDKKINAYEYRGYARYVDSLENYYKVSLEFLNLDISSAVFKSNWPIYTLTNDTPPAKYLKDASVKKSFIANGALINGTVENSIIGRDVEIGTGAIVKNSIIFTGAKIAEGAVVVNTIMDKRSQVKIQKDLIGDPQTPLYVKEGDVV